MFSLFLTVEKVVRVLVCSAIFKKIDHRICIKFCLKNGIKSSTAFEMLTMTFGESTMSKTRVYEWYKRFKESREDDNSPGRPNTSTTDDNVEQVKKMILENRRITIREVADDVGISFGSCQAIFSDVLGMKRVEIASR